MSNIFHIPNIKDMEKKMAKLTANVNNTFPDGAVYRIKKSISAQRTYDQFGASIKKGTEQYTIQGLTEPTTKSGSRSWTDITVYSTSAEALEDIERRGSVQYAYYDINGKKIDDEQPAVIATE